MDAATFPADAVSPQDLIHKADSALYHSKRAGRNRTTIWRQEREALVEQAAPSH